MSEYRLLSDDEVRILERQGCMAEDWTAVNVAEDFTPGHVRDVCFYGEVFLGVFEKNIEVSEGFLRHSGIRNAVLRNVTVGDNCLIENIGSCINNYEIGDDCLVCNVCKMETTEGATFGSGNIISVLNEAGDGNVVVFDALTSQLAALMVRYSRDEEFTGSLRRLVRQYVGDNAPERGTVGSRVKIVNTGEIANTCIYDGCEIDGACRLSECTLMSAPDAGVYIGSGVICEDTVVSYGSSVLNSAKLSSCFVGEACRITNGFVAENSLFFANSYMSGGEACAAFCGPFSASHHKSSLLIGGMFSFYNAGSATNFSNHAYKMGPLHYGCLERGTKTASGSHILMPASIGAFSVCLGKIAGHPDTSSLPFSYVISDGSGVYIVPGRNIMTAGLYRDVRKWPRRDMRPHGGVKSIVNFCWLSPFTVGKIVEGRRILETLRQVSGDTVREYAYQGCVIRAGALRKGLDLYDMAVKMFIGMYIRDIPAGELPAGDVDEKWSDLSGMLLPEEEERRLVRETGSLDDIGQLLGRLDDIHSRYRGYCLEYVSSLVRDRYGMEELTEDSIRNIARECDEARRMWLEGIKEDARKEYGLGDVEPEVLDSFIEQIEKELNQII